MSLVALVGGRLTFSMDWNGVSKFLSHFQFRYMFLKLIFFFFKSHIILVIGKANFHWESEKVTLKIRQKNWILLSITGIALQRMQITCLVYFE